MTAIASLPSAISELVGELAAYPAVRRIILFGSRSRGDNTPRSDVDLAVEAPSADPHVWDAICSDAEAAETLLAIDLVRLDHASPAFRERVRSEGTVLFDRDTGSAVPGQSAYGADTARRGARATR